MTEPKREIPEAPFDNGVGKIVSGNGVPLPNGDGTQMEGFGGEGFGVNRLERNPREPIALMGLVETGESRTIPETRTDRSSGNKLDRR